MALGLDVLSCLEELVAPLRTDIVLRPQEYVLIRHDAAVGGKLNGFLLSPLEVSACLGSVLIGAQLVKEGASEPGSAREKASVVALDVGVAACPIEVVVGHFVSRLARGAVEEFGRALTSPEGACVLLCEGLYLVEAAVIECDVGVTAGSVRLVLTLVGKQGLLGL